MQMWESGLEIYLQSAKFTHNKLKEARNKLILGGIRSSPLIYSQSNTQTATLRTQTERERESRPIWQTGRYLTSLVA